MAAGSPRDKDRSDGRSPLRLGWIGGFSALRGCGLDCAEFVGEAVEDGFAGWSFYEAVDGYREQNEDDIGEPGVEGYQMKALGDVVDV